MSIPRTGSRPKTATPRGRRRLRHWLTVAAFLLPALIVVGALLVYPIIFTIIRSTFDKTGTAFIGLGNYEKIFSEPRTLIAVRNNIIWVIFVPAIVTFLGLIFAVLSERVRWTRAFRMSLFMPLVVSGLAAGVTFRFVYAGDPEVGLANAAIRAVVHTFQPPGPYPTARPSVPEKLESADTALVSAMTYEPGETAHLGLVGIPPFQLPAEASAAAEPEASTGNVLQGVVWLDFSRGGGGTKGVVDVGETGLPNMRVELLQDGSVLASTRTEPNGYFAFENLASGAYGLRLAESNFRPPFGGIPWLAPLLITPAIIVGYIWIHTGFALIIIGAGLAGINRELQESARVEGANEWQVFRFVTTPLLRPVLVVVFVTTTISVLKIFDLVLVIAPESVQYHANVLALEMWRASFGGARDFGLGSALATLLFLLIVPAMIFNLRRFQLES